MRILVLFTMVSFEEGYGAYFAALAGHALRLGRHPGATRDSDLQQLLQLGGCDAPVDNPSPSP
jgi:hypothetical protein